MVTVTIGTPKKRRRYKAFKSVLSSFLDKKILLPCKQQEIDIVKCLVSKISYSFNYLIFFESQDTCHSLLRGQH